MISLGGRREERRQEDDFWARDRRIGRMLTATWVILGAVCLYIYVLIVHAVLS